MIFVRKFNKIRELLVAAFATQWRLHFLLLAQTRNFCSSKASVKTSKLRTDASNDLKMCFIYHLKPTLTDINKAAYSGHTLYGVVGLQLNIQLSQGSVATDVR